MSETVHYGPHDEDVDSLADEIKALLHRKNATLIGSTSMYGTLLAGSKRVPLLRIPTAFATDCLLRRDAIPAKALFIGLMILPRDDAAPWLFDGEADGDEEGER